MTGQKQCPEKQTKEIAPAEIQGILNNAPFLP